MALPNLSRRSHGGIRFGHVCIPFFWNLDFYWRDPYCLLYFISRMSNGEGDDRGIRKNKCIIDPDSTTSLFKNQEGEVGTWVHIDPIDSSVLPGYGRAWRWLLVVGLGCVWRLLWLDVTFKGSLFLAINWLE